MNIELVAQNNISGEIYDISELAFDISWETQLGEQPGKLMFSYTDEPAINILEGSPVSFKVNNQGVFFGYVFKKSPKKNGDVQITAYDQMRYLKNSDTYVIANMTASQVFAKICKDFKLKYNILDHSSYVLSSRVFDNKTLFSINTTGIDETLAYTGNWYTIRDNFGTLEFVNLNRLKTDVVIGDESDLTDYTFESSIDEDTYNQVKLVKENSDTKKRELYVIKDSSTIKNWGTLQYFETVDENVNAAQIAQRAQMILRLKNRVTKSLKLECLGSLKVQAGSGIVISIEELVKHGLAANQYFLVTACTHQFKNDLHTMSLQVQVSI